MLKKYTENQKENAYWGNLMYNYAFTGYDGYKDYEKTLNSITPDDLKKFVKKLLKQGNEIEVSMVGIEYTFLYLYFVFGFTKESIQISFHSLCNLSALPFLSS